MNCLVSILIPAYNAQQWIADTIKSALGQTWPRKEIIVVDDGSTDQTFSVAQRFASKDVLVFSQKNQGASNARNKAYTLCQGTYIQWLDADDLLAPEKVAKQMEVFERISSKRTLLSSAWGYFYYRSDKAVFRATPLWKDKSPLEWLLCKLGQNLSMQTGTWLASRELTDAAGPWDARLLGDDDGEYFCRVILACDGIRFVPEAKTFYRAAGPDSLGYIGRSGRKMEAHLLSLRLQINYLRSLEDSERVRAACLNFLQGNLICFYPDRLDLVEQARELAASLGGKLDVPKLSWKYAWIRRLFGWPVAKLTQLYYNQCKSFVNRSLDKAFIFLKH